VYLQADAQFRANPEDIGNLYVRSDQNQMIPLSNLVKITPLGRKQLLTSTCSDQLNSTVRKLKAVALDRQSNNGAASRGSATEYGL